MARYDSGGGGGPPSSAISLTDLTQVNGSTAPQQFLKGNGPGVANSWALLTASPANPGDNGKVAIALNGDFVYALITDANVSNAAALTVSKLAPSGINGQALTTIGGVPTWGTDFVAETLTTTGNLVINNALNPFIQLGGTAAGAGHAPTAGVIRIANGKIITWRNNADTQNVNVLQLGSTDNVVLGDSAQTQNLTLQCLFSVSFTVAGVSNTFRFDSATGLSSKQPFSFDSGLAAPSIMQGGSTTAAGKSFIIAAQSTTFAATNGGILLLRGGDSSGGFPGSVLVSVGTNQTLVQLSKNATGRMLGLVVPATINSGNVPSGDLICVIGNAATIPAADSTAGVIMYSDGQKPAWRFNGTNFRLNGTSNAANTGALAALPALPAGYLDVQINGTQQKMPYYAA